MRRASLPAFVSLSLALACTPDPQVQQQQQTGGAPDAATTSQPDGGRVDGDAGRPDAAVHPDGSVIVEEPDAGPVEPPTPTLAQGLAISEIALFQAVKIPLASDGEAVALRSAPVVAGRPAVIRVAVAPEGAWTARDVTAILEVESAGGVHSLNETLQVTGASIEADADSLFTFTFTPAQGDSYRVLLTAHDGVEVPDGVANSARFPPTGGAAPLDAEDDLGGIRVVLVPIEYNTDDSGRLPDTSDEQLARYRAVLEALYPITTVELTVREPLPWSRFPTLSGNFNFGRLNDELIDLRGEDGADDDVYYYGLVAPDETFDDYCNWGCVTGQSYVVDDPADADIRVGGGVGFTGEDSAWTLAHELGHMLGRYHAPCDVNSWDEDYPYDNGEIGVWGHDARSGEFIAPDAATDFMGYCEVTWTSDYTYDAIFARVVAVNSLPQTLALPRRAVRVLHVAADGTATWSARVRLRDRARPVAGVQFLDAKAAIVASASADLLATGHGDSVSVLVPEAPAAARAVRVLLPGRAPITMPLTAAD